MTHTVAQMSEAVKAANHASHCFTEIDECTRCMDCEIGVWNGYREMCPAAVYVQQQAAKTMSVAEVAKELHVGQALVRGIINAGLMEKVGTQVSEQSFRAYVASLKRTP